MNETGSSKVTRRHLLQIVAACSLALTAPALAEQRSQPKKKRKKARAPLSLHVLVSGLIGCSKDARDRRVAFDRNPVDTIKSAHLNPKQWRVFVAMEPNEIKDAVADELEKAGFHSEAGLFKSAFEAFLKDWEKGAPECCDGYDPNPEWCNTDHGHNCERQSISSPRYYLPGPHVMSADLSSDGKTVTVHGEGFLPGALVEVWTEDTFNTGTPHKTYEPDHWTALPSTFRCSQLAFEHGLSTGKYEVRILNRSDDKSESHRLKDSGKFKV